jgi:pyruvate,water dikinase
LKSIIYKYLYSLIIVLGSFSIASVLFAYQTCKENEERKNIAGARKDYLLAIGTQADFDLLKGDPLSNTYSNVACIKITYDIKTGTLYFIHSKNFKYHIDFCTQILGYNKGLELFNAYNYSDSKKREYYLATLNYYRSSGNYTLEFVSEDQINSLQILELYSLIKQKTFFGNKLKLFIDNNNLQKMDSSKSFDSIQKIYPSDLYGTQNYQSLNKGIAIGYLKLIPDLKKDFTNITSHDIIIINGTPISLPPCAAVITNSFQTPLSHINLLTHNRGIPSAAQRNIFSDKEITSRVNKLVKIYFYQDSLWVMNCDIKEAESYWKRESINQNISLNYDVKSNTLIDIEDINYRSNKTVGSKAANFGELCKIQKRNSDFFKTPESAFAIPFYFYHQHISSNNISIEIDRLLNNTIYKSNNDSLKHQLKKIRTLIIKSPVSSELLKSIKNKVEESGYSFFRFRSSTNIEDIDGFNGAGLYTSKTGILNSTTKTIEVAIKEVWASVFLYKAYQERNIFHINERDVMMGILVHRNFPDEIANGVAITKNIYRNTFPGYIVNVQLGETSVVAPEDTITSEQFICMNTNQVDISSNNIVADYIIHSSITKNKNVLTQSQIEKLYFTLELIQNHFQNKKGFIGNACDVEFKFDSNGDLYIKQVRVYN